MNKIFKLLKEEAYIKKYFWTYIKGATVSNFEFISDLPNYLLRICLLHMDLTFLSLIFLVQNNIKEINEILRKHFELFRIMPIYFLLCLSLVINLVPIFSETEVYNGETLEYLLLGSLPLTSWLVSPKFAPSQL